MPAFVLLTAVLRAAPAAAQAPSDMVPRELVEALVGANSFFGPSTLVVGRAPDGFPAPLPDGAARALGGVTRGTFVREAVFTTADAPEAARAAYLRALDAAGWRAAPATDRERAPAGFVAADVQFESGMETRCGPGDAALSVRAVARPAGGSRLHLVVIQPPPGPGTYGPCSASSPSERGRPGRFVSPIPALTAPPGAALQPQGSGASDDQHHTMALVTGAADATSAVAHFARQFAVAGWTVGPAVAGDGLAARRVTSPADSAGVRWSGVLWVAPLAGAPCAGAPCRPPLEAAVVVTGARAGGW